MIWYIFISTTGPGLLYFEEYVSIRLHVLFQDMNYIRRELLDTIDISYYNYCILLARQLYYIYVCTFK